MAILTSDSIQTNAPKAIDNRAGRFIGGVWLPYTSIAQVNAAIPVAYRHIGLVVLITVGAETTEYWYKNGTGDQHLVEKYSGGGISSITAGANMAVDTETTPGTAIISSTGGAGSFVTLASISALQSYVGAETFLYVSHALTGGFFTKSYEALTADNGAIYPASGGGFWVRQYDKVKGLNPCWFGCIPNGIFDCTAILNTLSYRCVINGENMYLPDGCFRITSTWVIGFQNLSAEDAMLYQTYNNAAPSYNIDAFTAQNFYKPIGVSGSSRTIIWGDFIAPNLTAIVHYGTWGVNLDMAGHAVKLENLIISGRTGIEYNSERGLFIVKHIPAADPGNLQMGLLFEHGDGTVSIETMQYHACKVGFNINGTYTTYMFNQLFTRCDIGFFNQGSHSATGYKFYAQYCKEAFIIQAGTSAYFQFNTEQCATSIICAGGHNTFNGIYLEDNAGSAGPDNYQVEIGYRDGDPRAFNVPGYIKGVSVMGGNITPLNGKALRVNYDATEVSFKNVNCPYVIMVTHPHSRLVMENVYSDPPQGAGDIRVLGAGSQVVEGGVIYPTQFQAQFYCSISGMSPVTFVQVGNIVMLSGQVTVTPESTTIPCGFSFLLPLGHWANAQFLHGHITSGTLNQSGAMSGYQESTQQYAWGSLPATTLEARVCKWSLTYAIQPDPGGEPV